MENAMYLGLNYSGYHDSSVALLDDQGQVHFAASEERYSRTKKDGRFPRRSLGQIDLSKVRQIAIPYLESTSTPADADPFFAEMLVEHSRIDLAGFAYPEMWRQELESLGKPLVFFDHHLSHAACGYFLSGFDRTLIITSDYGARHCAWNMCIYLAEDGQLRPLHQASHAHYSPLCSLYSDITAVLGFRPNMHEGKITGLAAYGEDNSDLEELLWLLHTEIRKSSPQLYEWVGLFQEGVSPTFETNPALVSEYRSRLAGFSDQQIARAVQSLTEKKLTAMLERVQQETPCGNLVLAGGIFANVKLNLEIKRTGFDRLFVCPPMGDEGVALGAAILARSADKKCSLQGSPVRNLFWGTQPSDDVSAELQKLGVVFHQPQRLAEEIAERLSDGKTVVRVTGRMEFGPRALGHRSLLCQPTDPTVNDWLNKKLKRTEFMPFAPIVLAERAHELFDASELAGAEHTAEFMTICFHCSEKFRELCPAVVHVDGTARPQLVNSVNQPELHAILAAYERRTGLPALINTSFNVHDEPIVESVRDAVVAFFQSGLDCLALGECLILAEENTHWTTVVGCVTNELLREQKGRQQALAHTYGQRIVKLQRDKEWLDEQRLNWKREAESSAAIVASQQAWINELEAAKAWLDEQRQKWQYEAQRAKALVNQHHLEPTVRE